MVGSWTVPYSPLSSPTSPSLVLALHLALARPLRVASTPTDPSLPGAFAAPARHIRDRGRGLLCAEDMDHGTGTGIGIDTLFETRSVEAEVGEVATAVLPRDVDLVLVAGDSVARRARVVPSCGVDMIVADHEGARPATNEEEGVNYPALSVRILIGAVGHDLPARLENEGRCPARGRALALAHVAFRGAVIHRIRVRRLVRARGLDRGALGV